MAEKLKSKKTQVFGILSVLGSIYLGVSLLSHSEWDPSFLTYTETPVRNYGGIIGSYLSDLLITLIGLSAATVPVFLFVFGMKMVLGKEKQKIHLIGAILFVISFSSMAALLRSSFSFNFQMDMEGLAGRYIAKFLKSYVSILGAYIFSLSAFLSSVILLSPGSAASVFSGRKQTSPDRKGPKKRVIEDDILIRQPEKEPEEHNSAADILPLFVEPPAAEKRHELPGKPAAAVGAGGYELPSIELLTLYEPTSRPSKDELLSNSSLLENKLRDFDVDGKITHVHPGPVVTLYEFEPAPGVKINRVVSLSDDLALAHKAHSMRVSPISGKAAIGIEVPNQQREIVSLRDIISSETFAKSFSKITLALGKDIAGLPVVADLARMPHLLVAGSTGAGKSVSMNSMVMSILYKASPAEVKMLMIDPKLLELSMYEDIPHLISPVITNPKKAAEALRKMVFEMERRYRLLAEKGTRDIESFNSQADAEDRLPYIVIFIDELADLMFASSNEVEDSITRLAQMARAAGIHLIIATQRPSVDVITGLIKANFPARISFQVFSKIDSRTILDTQGAEQLLGKGDMLLMLPGSRIKRVHGALVTADEITSVTGFIKSQGKPDYSILEAIPEPDEQAEAEATGERDDMYYKAVEFGEAVGEISISSLQRRFKIGYNRAARLMELMEDDGLVGPPKGAGKPRDFIRRHNL